MSLHNGIYQAAEVGNHWPTAMTLDILLYLRKLHDRRRNCRVIKKGVLKGSAVAYFKM
jgi:hypothetical protein